MRVLKAQINTVYMSEETSEQIWTTSRCTRQLHIHLSDLLQQQRPSLHPRLHLLDLLLVLLPPLKLLFPTESTELWVSSAFLLHLCPVGHVQHQQQQNKMFAEFN